MYLERTTQNKHLNVSLYTYVFKSVPVHKIEAFIAKCDMEFLRMDYWVIQLDFLLNINEEDFSQ